MGAGGLYILDQLFFALSFSLKNLFQKIGDPKDMAPTSAVAFTINHIAAVFLRRRWATCGRSRRIMCSCWGRGWRCSRSCWSA